VVVCIMMSSPMVNLSLVYDRQTGPIAELIVFDMFEYCKGNGGP
jgi:hypothetical protein